MFSLKKEKKPQGLKELFNLQLEILIKRDCPLPIVENFKREQERVLDHASSLSIEEGHLAFLPVILPNYLGYYGLMKMVRHNDREGLVECEINRISDLQEVPTGLYYIFDVDDGSQWQGRAPDIAAILIHQGNRLPLTAVEIINAILHTDWLTDHTLNAIGSSFASDRTPRVWLNVIMSEADRNGMYPVVGAENSLSLLKVELGRPGLGWWYTSSPSQGGASSCVSRLAI